MRKPNQYYDVIRPEPENLLQSSRAFGYTVETAIADLIDNSITANSKVIKITFGMDYYASFLRVEDNGDGMCEEELLNAMRFGSFNPIKNRNIDDLGRFGLGLKTASFSQCKRLTVKTRNKLGKEFVRCWDLDIVAEKKEWILLRSCADNKSEINLGEFSNYGSGTIVLWEKLDRLVESGELISNKEHFYRKFDNVKKHLGIIFHRFIQENKISIIVNKEEIEALNPFNISDKIPSAELQEEQLSINGQMIFIQPYILPHESKLTQDDRKLFNLIKGWTAHQGIYLYRNKRLISDGSWLDLDIKKKENQRLCRIRIDIPNTLDTEWQIDVKKASAKIPDVIRKRIKSICLTAIDKAINVYMHRGAYIKRKEVNRGTVYFWRTRQKHGKRHYEINEEHPICQLIYDCLGKDAYIFKDYNRLISESLPIGCIVSDFADPTSTIMGYFEGSLGELKAIYNNTITALINAGFTTNEAINKVNQIECFHKLKED